jgi:hypothetical protein
LLINSLAIAHANEFRADNFILLELPGEKTGKENGE